MGLLSESSPSLNIALPVLLKHQKNLKKPLVTKTYKSTFRLAQHCCHLLKRIPGTAKHILKYQYDGIGATPASSASLAAAPVVVVVAAAVAIAVSLVASRGDGHRQSHWWFFIVYT